MYVFIAGQMYAMQQGIKLAKGDEVAKSILLKMMSDIEAVRVHDTI